MRRAALRSLCLAALVLPALCAGPARAQDGVTVFIDRPEPFAPVFGQVTVEAVVVADEPIRRVVFYVDDVVMGELTEPPYTLDVPVGDDNRPHRFEVLAYGASGATGSASVTTPAVRVDEEVAVNLQQLYVTVSDRSGGRIRDLGAEDFRILDERKGQQLVTFARGDIPFTATVLLDSSRSMEGEKLEAAVRGAKAFFEGMKRLDEGRLLVFSDRVLHSTPVTTFRDVLTAGLPRVEARGGSAVADHLYMALQQIGERQGRRVIVLLSDGVDSHSALDMEEALRMARRSQALLYWLRLTYSDGPTEDGQKLPSLRSAWRSPKEYWRQYETLERAVTESGGRIWDIGGLGDIQPAFRGILSELRDQYVLGYYPSNARHDGDWRRVEVEVDRRGLEARSQRGYVDF